MTDDILLIHTDDRVRTLTLNRPQSRNALSAALRDQFFTALADAETDDAVDVVILTGTDPVFCAGLDLKELGGQSALPDISPRWPPLTKPVIGAINGAAVTGGLELALYCDILIASEHARFADTHARVGLLPTWGLSVRLPQKVGIGVARRMSLTGDYLSAASFLGIAGAIAVYGYDGFLYSIGFLVAWLVALLLVAELLRNAGKFTMADVLSFRLKERPVRLAGPRYVGARHGTACRCVRHWAGSRLP